MTRRQSYFPLRGGLDLVTAPLAIEPGRLEMMFNYEVAPDGGYRRTGGYERFDGQPAPSDASGVIGSVGASEQSRLSLIPGLLPKPDSSFDESDRYDLLGLWVGGVEDRRAAIEAVPGSGPVRGVATLNGTVYAFRDNAAGTACDLYESTSSGWSQISFGRTLDFDAGTAEFLDGETVTGGTSGATATIERVSVQSGGWGGSDADGYLVLSGVSGTFQDDETITSSSGSATADGADAAISLNPGGRYEIILYNFTGSPDTLALYGCDGENAAFEFDGSVYSPIRTGMSTDKPEHIAAHRRHLFLSFDGGSVQHSAIGDPFSWTLNTGASEIAQGDSVTGLLPLAEDALAIFARNSTRVLYGTSASEWNLGSMALQMDGSGALPYTQQLIGIPVYMDDIGIRVLQSTAAYGNFATNTTSRQIQPLISQARQSTVASVTRRNLSQYMLFLSDKRVIVMTVVGKEVLGFGVLLLDHQASCAWSGEDTDGAELAFFGADDGFVYQMLDDGKSFDGEPIRASMRLPFNHVGSPRHKKRFRQAFFDLTAQDEVTIKVQPAFDYGGQTTTPRTSPHTVVDVDNLATQGGLWDLDEWGEFTWGDQYVAEASIAITGAGRNMALLIYTEDDSSIPHTFHGIVLDYSPRGLRRH